MTASKLNKNRYDGIQALRFIAALMVVITHSFLYASDRLGAGTANWRTGTSGVDIFFVISGFVMVLSSQSLIGRDDGWKIFMKKRIIRLAPLYWVATTFKLIILLLAAGVVLHSTLDWEMIIKSYFFIPSKNPIDGSISPFLGVGWTLIFEMFFYTIFGLSLLLKKNVYQFVGAVLFVFSFASFFQGNSDSTWWYLMNPIILEFYIGMIIGYYALKGKFLPRKVSVPMLLVALAYMFFTDNPYTLPRIINKGVPAAMLVWAIISLEPQLKGRIPSWVMFLGAASYALYLFHPLISPIAPVILGRIGLSSFPLSITLSILIALVASYFGHVWIEKPLNNLFTPLLKRTPEQRISKPSSNNPIYATSKKVDG